MLKAIDHVQIAIPVGGEAQARPFYGDLLGLTEVPKPAELAKRGGAWFEAGAVKVHLGVEQDFRANVKAHVAFVVDDVADIASRATAAGYETKANDEIDGVERVFIFDPFGNRLEFLAPLLPLREKVSAQPTDEGSKIPSAGETPHPTRSAGHLLPQGEKENAK